MSYIRTILVLLLLCTRARAETSELIFSVKSWEGGYSSKDVPGGVEATAVVGAIYRINADGSGLQRLVQLGKNTDYPTFSPDGKWIYFQSNASLRRSARISSGSFRCRVAMPAETTKKANPTGLALVVPGFQPRITSSPRRLPWPVPHRREIRQPRT